MISSRQLVSALLLSFSVGAANADGPSPEEQLRFALDIPKGTPVTIWSVRDRVMTRVKKGQSQSVAEQQMASFGWLLTSYDKPTQCTMGDRGMYCEFKSAPGDKDKRTWWIELDFSSVPTEQLSDVIVTIWRKGRNQSTDPEYFND